MMLKGQILQHLPQFIRAFWVLPLCCFWVNAQERPSRIVTIGNLHGEYEVFVSLLKNTQLVGEDLQWTGADGVLIQTGDFMDRGSGVREIMDLLRNLEEQAEQAGGCVITLLGDHEAMNILGAMREINPGVFEDFVDSSSKSRRTEAFNQYLAHYKATQNRIIKPHEIKALRRQWKDRYPLGYLEYVQAMGPTGVYGKWLRSLPTTVVVDGTLFIHGGINPESNFKTIQSINAEIASHIKTSDKLTADLFEANLTFEFNTWLERYQAASDTIQELALGSMGDLSAEDGHRVEVARAFQNFAGGLLMDSDGPLSFKGYAQWDEFEGRRYLASILADLGVSHVVCSHTPQADGTQSRFDGKVFLINTGIVYGPKDDLDPAALEIKNGSFTAVYENSRQPLEESSRPEQMTKSPADTTDQTSAPQPQADGI